MAGLKETFVDELKDLYDAEKQLLAALPRMAEAAESEELKGAFEEHMEQTEEHLKRLDKVFGAFEEVPRGKKCKGMHGLIEEAKELIEKKEGDAALIAAAQKAEHYEISAYGTLSSWAGILEENEVVDLLQETLNEEKGTDEKLTEIAESTVNAEEEEENEGEEEPKAKESVGKASSKKK